MTLPLPGFGCTWTLMLVWLSFLDGWVCASHPAARHPDKATEHQLVDTLRLREGACALGGQMTQDFWDAHLVNI